MVNFHFCFLGWTMYWHQVVAAWWKCTCISCSTSPLGNVKSFFNHKWLWKLFSRSSAIFKLGAKSKKNHATLQELIPHFFHRSFTLHHIFIHHLSSTMFLSIIYPPPCFHPSFILHHVFIYHLPSIMFSFIIYPSSCDHALLCPPDIH